VLRGLAEQLDACLGESLAELLTADEVQATRNRVARLVQSGQFPLPSTDWPAIPYPPY
jgi:HAMP domain-containing protein